MVKVSVRQQGEPLFSCDVDKPEITVGRGQDNDIVLPHGTVSRRHARIIVRNGAIYVVDDGSSNGTYIDGQRITSAQPLSASQTFYCGIFSIEVRESAPQQPARFGEPMSSAPVSYGSSERWSGQHPGVDQTAKTYGAGELNVRDLEAAMAARERQAQGQQRSQPPSSPPSYEPSWRSEPSRSAEPSWRSEPSRPAEPSWRSEPSRPSEPSWRSEPSRPSEPSWRSQAAPEDESSRRERRWGYENTGDEAPRSAEPRDEPTWRSEAPRSPEPPWRSEPPPAEKPPREERRRRSASASNGAPYLDEDDEEVEAVASERPQRPVWRPSSEDDIPPPQFDELVGPSVLRGPSDE